MRDLPDGCVRLWAVPSMCRTRIVAWEANKPSKMTEGIYAPHIAAPVAAFDALLDKAGRVEGLERDVAALRAALAFYADAENYQPTVVVEDTMGGNVPVGCQDPEAHIRATFGEDVARIAGDERLVLPHECAGDPDGPTRRWSGDTQVRPWGQRPVMYDGGAKAREALEVKP